MGCLGERPLCRCRILFLDGTEIIREIKSDSLGQELLDQVFKHLNLVETVYFGLRYLDGSNQTHWLDPNKKIAKQLKGGSSFTLYFGVKFYASDPCKLVEEITRYQFFLQVKQDILQGRLPVAFDLAAELAGYAIQSELGDYDPRRHSMGYVSEFNFIAGQSVEFESNTAEIHKMLSGQVPAMAELNYLEKIKWLDMYGVDLHPVLGEDNVEYFLGLTPSGIIVLRNKTKVGNYFWPRITKVYFKGRYFMLRVRDKNNEENTYGFGMVTKQASKHLWKCCIEQHAFFRLMQVNSSPAGGLFKFTSKFKNSGNVEMQTREMDAIRPPPLVRRVPSQRGQRRLPPTDGIDNSFRNDTTSTQPANIASTILSSSALQSYPSMHRSTSVPVVLPLSDSPRSTRSAPWGNGKHRGLYSTSVNPSPRSVRSTSTKHSLRLRASQQMLGSESSYNGHHHHKHHRNESENEEYPKSPRSGHSKSRHRKNRSGSRTRDSGSESESQQKSQRSRHRSNNNNNDYELVSSEAQWCEVQRQQAKQPQNAVIKELANSHHSGYTNSGMESESEFHYRHRKKYRRHSRSRSRSPDGPKRPSEELRKHLEFKLVDTSGFSEAQLKSIPYTRVELEEKSAASRPSPTSRQKHKAIKHQKDDHEQKVGMPANDDIDINRNGMPQHLAAMSTPLSPVSKAQVHGSTNYSGSPASSIRSVPHRNSDHFLSINNEAPNLQMLENNEHLQVYIEEIHEEIQITIPSSETFQPKIHHEMSTEL